jgi:homoserine dehydrogenase
MGAAGEIIVLKFGSSVLRSRAQLPTAVHEIYHWYRAGWRVVAIVSAIGNTTETLLAEARTLSDEPEPNATAELLATGERHSAALLGIALDRAGVRAKVIDPREIGLTTVGSALDSEPVAVDCACLKALLDKSPVVVVPGFFGYADHGQLQLLGRGGSDLSAVYLANALGASRCRLVKDVDGVYERDPALNASLPTRRFVTLGYAEALQRAGQLIQPKAVRFLERHSASAQVAGIARAYESTVGKHDRALVAAAKVPPLSVLVLGLGTVGFGVYQRINAMREQFHIKGALVRSRAKHAGEIAEELLYDSPEAAAESRPDIVVDALPGLEPSLSLVRQYLARGVHVVSANKTLIAEAGVELSALATRNAASLLYSAAVGGSVPMLETLDHEANRGGIRAIAGVLNGTCNYVLDRCAEGLSLDDAVRAAQQCGFAEADPSEDLSGRDAARKLTILSRKAFGQELTSLEIEPLNSSTLSRGRTALHANETLRFIARARKVGDRLLGQIQLEAIGPEDAFAQTRGEWNRLLISHANGEEIAVSGRGAGRWPTTEAIMADLLDLSEGVPAVEEISARTRRTDTSFA